MGPAYQRSEVSDNDERDVPDLCCKIGPLVPGPGEPRNDIVDMVAHVHHRVIELMAGTAAEALLLADDPPWDALSDLRQARALASLVCTSEQSIEALISFGVRRGAVDYRQASRLGDGHGERSHHASRAYPQRCRDRRGDHADARTRSDGCRASPPHRMAAHPRKRWEFHGVDSAVAR
jgi:hypothetical protein